MDIEDLKNHPVTDIQTFTIIADNSLRVRYPTLDHGHVVRLRRAWLDGKKIPPIAVQAHTNKLIFGWHRLTAHKDAFGGAGTIKVYVLDVDDATAIRLALAENAANGLPMRKIDLQQAALVAKERGLSDAETVQLLNIHPGMLMTLRRQVGQFHRGPEAGERYAYRRGSQPSGLDNLTAMLTQQAAAAGPSGSNGNGHHADDLTLAATVPALAEEDADDDPMVRVHGRFPTPAWLNAFMNSPLATPSGDVILKQSLRHLQGCALTEVQVRANRFVAGTPQLTLVRQLVVLIYADALNIQSAKLVAALRDLRLALGTLDLSAAEAADDEEPEPSAGALLALADELEETHVA